MDNGKNKPSENLGEIDELLNDFDRQKEKHIESFGEIELPKEEESNKKSGSKHGFHKNRKDGESTEKSKKKFSFSFKNLIPKDKAKRKKLIIGAVCVVAAAGIVAGSVLIYDNATTGYLKPYEEKYPDVKFPVGIKAEYCDYYALHQNMTGYISIPDCDYADYILPENVTTQNPTLDGSNSTGTLDFNTVVYINSKKCNLESAYKDMSAYLKSEQKITYSTLYEDYEFNVIGAFYTNTNPADDNGYCFPYNFTKQMTGASFNNYIDRITSRFLYNTGYELSYKNDRLITVATDSDFMENTKFVVIGVLNGEKQTEAEVNNSVHYPQAWYDANGKTNPYRFADEWYPTVFTDDKQEETSVQSQKDF